MKYSYRITKYTPNDDGSLYSSPNEWTGFDDIGSKVTNDEYEKTERDYIDYILAACKCLDISALKIKELELNIKTYKYKEGSLVPLSEIEEVVKAILRENIWCKLISEKCQFHFGYDFYMYFICNSSPGKCIEQIKTPLTIQRYKSPYL